MGTGPKTDRTDALKSIVGRLVQGSTQEVQASFDVKQTAGETVLLIDLPGVDEDEIKVSVTRGVLNVFADREFNHDTEDAEEYTLLNRPYGTFHCAFELPPTADADSMTAKYVRGVLKIRIPSEKSRC